MKKKNVFKVILAVVIYLALFVLASSSGLIHPACYAYAGTAVAFFLSFLYLLTAANVRTFGAAAILNGFLLAVGLLMGEGNAPMIIGMIALALLTELIRGIVGYDKLKGIRASFVPLAFSFYAYAAHWWTETEGSLAEAQEIMPAGCPDKMLPVIENRPMLIVFLALTVPVAMIGMRLAEKIMKKQAAVFE